MKPEKEKMIGIIGTSLIVSVMVISGFALGTPNDLASQSAFGNDNVQPQNDNHQGSHNDNPNENNSNNFNANVADGPEITAASWVAFCSYGGLTKSEVTKIKPNETKDDGPISVDWATSSDVDYIIVKFDSWYHSVFKLDGSMNGTVRVGDGVVHYTDDFKGDAYCSGYQSSLSGVKFEWNGSSFRDTGKEDSTIQLGPIEIKDLGLELRKLL